MGIWSPKAGETKGNQAFRRAKRAGKINFLEPESRKTKENEAFRRAKRAGKMGIWNPKAGEHLGLGRAVDYK